MAKFPKALEISIPSKVMNMEMYILINILINTVIVTAIVTAKGQKRRKATHIMVYHVLVIYVMIPYYSKMCSRP